MDKITFGDAERDDIELVRSVVLQRLRDDGRENRPPFQLDPTGDGYQRYITFPNNNHQGRFLELAIQVSWELIVQGVIVPGGGGSVGSLPFFCISDYGRKVLEAGHIIPHDPQRYVEKIRATSRICMNAVAFAYLQEALSCFMHSCYTASVLLVGVATEAAFLEFCDVAQKSIRDPKSRDDFAKRDLVKRKHRWIVTKYESLTAQVKREKLPDGLDVSLKAVYDLIRRQRNELGHPQEMPPAIDRDHAFAHFQLFPTYIGDLEAFADYCQKYGL